MRSEIRRNVEYRKLGDVTDIIMGQSPKGNSYNSNGFGVPLINGPTEFTNKYPIKRQWTTEPTKCCKKQDILICVRGSSTGRMNISDDIYCIGRGVAAISAKRVALTEYIYFLLDFEVDRILKSATGSTFPNITGKELNDLNMNIFPLPEQQKIANILSTWDKAIELKENLIEKKIEQKKGLMKKLFTGQIRLPGFVGVWKYFKAGEIFCNMTDKSHNGIGVVLSSTQDKGIIPRDKINIDIKYDKESLSNYKKVNIGEFVISLRSFQGGIEYSEFEGLMSPAYTVLKNLVDIESSFYRHLFKSVDFISRLNGLIYGIRDGKQIGYKDFSTMILPYPEIEEQKQIGEILDTATREINLHQQELDALKLQKKGLMQLLLTGIVRVNN